MAILKLLIRIPILILLVIALAIVIAIEMVIVIVILLSTTQIGSRKISLNVVPFHQTKSTRNLK